MRIIVLFAVVICLSSSGISLAQHPNAWERSEQKDPFSGAEYSQFVLFGRYLTAPTDQTAEQPHLVVQCIQKNSKAYHGKLLHAYLAAGALVHQGVLVGQHIDDRVAVDLRLDDGKPQSDYWTASTNLQGIFFGETTLSNILYGHMLPHKVNSSPPVKKLLLQVDEALANKIVIQFDMPNPDEVADACGVIIHR